MGLSDAKQTSNRPNTNDSRASRNSQITLLIDLVLLLVTLTTMIAALDTTGNGPVRPEIDTDLVLLRLADRIPAKKITSRVEVEMIAMMIEETAEAGEERDLTQEEGAFRDLGQETGE